MFLVYCTFVRSNLEYVSQVLNPRHNIYTERIERIQRKFIKYLCFKLNIAYNSNNYDNLCKNIIYFLFTCGVRLPTLYII